MYLGFISPNALAPNPTGFPFSSKIGMVILFLNTSEIQLLYVFANPNSIKSFTLYLFNSSSKILFLSKSYPI